GIGMAAELAVLLDDKIAHPAIEALFTVDEETGLTGAFNLGEGMITGKYLINLDSEDEGEIFIGCAGGIGTVASFSYRKEALPEAYAWFRAEVSGLKGGHSGDNIDDGLGNSNKIMTRLLIAGEKLGLRLADFDGGNLHNAIPREAHAVVGVPAAKADEFKALVASLGAAVKDELQYTDAGVQLTAEECAAPEFVVDADTQHRLLLALEGVPNGVFAMSFAMPGLVETSSNLASVKFKGDEIVVVLSHRSSLESSKNDVALAAESVFALAGAKVTHNEGYPGWAPNPNSELLGVVNASYEKLFGKQPKVRAIHAGLECGLFLKMYPWLDMVSFGPTLRGVHSPDERIEISTVEKFWDLLVDVLAEIK
ncbi:MAG: beta-Ala-His dipeptidase, partial [Tidjanibacter sp.]|nr:beta-Ala-His dipeptidase [Tidjanibacter sp.]